MRGERNVTVNLSLQAAVLLSSLKILRLRFFRKHFHLPDLNPELTCFSFSVLCFPAHFSVPLSRSFSLNARSFSFFFFLTLYSHRHVYNREIQSNTVSFLFHLAAVNCGGMIVAITWEAQHWIGERPLEVWRKKRRWLFCLQTISDVSPNVPRQASVTKSAIVVCV